MKTFKSLFEFILHFSNNDTCRQHLEDVRWKGTPVCPYCSSTKSYRLEKTKSYRCANADCKKTYTVLKGTIFENSNLPLSKWFAAICISSSHKKGISSHQLAKDIGVTQTTAWHILHRIREAMNNNELFIQEMEGVVELDESFVGGKNKNRHWDKKVKNSQGRSFGQNTCIRSFRAYWICQMYRCTRYIFSNTTTISRGKCKDRFNINDR